MLIVQKFGGTSVASPQRIARVVEHLTNAARQGHRVVGVVSAQGDLTDRLIEKIGALSAQPSLRETDACLAAGEQISAALVAMAVEAAGFPAVSLTGWQSGLVTDGVHGDARIEGLANSRITQELERGRIVIVAGFQGISPGGDITTLGRGGSDTTAVALAALLGADRCLIYTDVDGVYDKDPRKYPDAVKYSRIGYDEMLALCHGGAQVLHDRCVELAKRHRIPIRVLSTFRDLPGTTVSDSE